MSVDWLSAKNQQGSPLMGSGMTSLVLTAVFVFVVLVYQYWSKRDFYRIASKIPGPTPLPFIGNALEYFSLDHSKVLDYLVDLMKKYDGTARIWLGQMLVIHISKPDDLEILMTNSKLIEKNKMYKFFDDVLGEGLLNASGDLWKKHRKIIAPTFHPSVLKHFVKIFDRQSKVLVQVLEEQKDGKEFNVFPYVRNCSLDFITETALENHIDAQLQPVSPATLAAERLMNITYNRMFKLWLFYDFIFYRTSEGKEYVRLREIVKESTEPMLEDKKKEMILDALKSKSEPEGSNKNERKSFFRQLVELNKNGQNFNDKELRDEVVTMIITGYETTAATVGFILVMLGIHQEVQERVYEEVVALQDYLKGRDLEAEDLTRFEYMDRVIKETLRLYPVGPVIFRQSTAEVPLATCVVPKGASVAVVILRTHRDPAYWDEPEKFNPDNFLPENVAKRHPYSYVPFSGGPRNCIGKNYANLAMKVMLFHMLSKYKILCDMKLEDVKIKSEVTMKMVGGFNIRLALRN